MAVDAAAARRPGNRRPRRRLARRRRDRADVRHRSRALHGRLLRGARPRVRRLVPAPRPIRPRRDPRRRLARRARHRRSMARCAAVRRARSSSWPPGRAGGRRCWRPRASCPCTTPRRRRSIGRASASWRTTCAPTCTCATRGRSPTAPVDGLFLGFWLSHVPRERLAEFLAPRAALAQARRAPSPSSIRCPTRRRARPTTRRPPTTCPLRRLADGREFTIVKVFYTPDELAAALDGGGLRGCRGHDDRPLLPDGSGRAA